MKLSPQLETHVQHALEALKDHPGIATALAAAPAHVGESVARVFASSDFVARACARDAGLLPALLASGDLLAERSVDDFARTSPWRPDHDGPLSDTSAISQNEYLAALRHWRRYEMVRIAWRDLAGWATLEQTLAELSGFADAAINAAYEYARRVLVARYGEPRSANGDALPLVVIAMGKLGGGELNFSSDIDLVFLFPEHGETDGPRPTTNEEFCSRLGQQMNRLLASPTVEGIVFRVDMRLRPFGESGPLVASFAAFEDYLSLHGRDWERYAYVKARPLTGQERFGEVYSAALRPFVYRRYLDYGVVASLREMKALIEREVERRELADHVKLGPGGIREIEFIVQAFQLIRGGMERKLQTTSLLTVLPMLSGTKLLPADVVRDLRDAYIFLRRLENRLQMLADEQAHRLPRDDFSRERIALAMNFADWSTLLQHLDIHRNNVSRHFKSVVFGVDAAVDVGTVKVDLGQFWDNNGEAAALAESFERAGVVESTEAARMLLELRGSMFVSRLDEPGRRRLQALLPPLITDIAATRAPIAALRRVLRIIEAIGQRSSYFALLHENAAARRRLVELCGHGDFLANQIALYPLLLDELIDERLLFDLPDRDMLSRDLTALMQQVRDEDPERQVEALRRFQRASLFRVAVADLTGRLPVMKVSDRLTEIAELIVDAAMELAWWQMTEQFGMPLCGDTDVRRAVRICAIGYGKLGGMELGYSSDLDLVFLHDSSGERQETDGRRPIDNQVFFVRLAQRIVHLLTMHSAAGRLYEVDVRLRPSGKGGMLVTQINAFKEYQQKEAWTWEHQALLHARAVAGDSRLRTEFERVRMLVLQDHVRREDLREQVRTMRERMRRELTKAGPGRFDIKQDAGGIADIEFLAQYWALQWARDFPPVAMFPDTIRELESVASANLVPQETVDILTEAYRTYRVRLHRLSLDGKEGIVIDDEFPQVRVAVTLIWNATMNG